jgi:GNAT superfamily N-acetyltransferase
MQRPNDVYSASTTADHARSLAVGVDGSPVETSTHIGPCLVPIRSLGPNHRGRICQHLISLDENDRYLRFGYAAQESHIRRYVDTLNFERDEVFGIYNRKLLLIAVAHLAYLDVADQANCVEFGVSVLPHARARGYGARLFDRATMHASNDGISRMFIHALSVNGPMLNIVRKAGATVVRDGAESQAQLLLAPSTLDTHVTEMLSEQIALTDYHLKVRAKQYKKIFAKVRAHT